MIKISIKFKWNFLIIFACWDQQMLHLIPFFNTTLLLSHRRLKMLTFLQVLNEI